MDDFKVEGGLLPSDFEYKFYLKDFFEGIEFWRYHRVNAEIYRFLTNVKRDDSIKGAFWGYLNFFNFLYEQLDIIEKHPNQPLNIIEHLKSLVIEDFQLYVFLKALHRFRFVFAPITLDMLDDSRYNIKLKSIISQRKDCPRKSWLWTCIDIIQGEFGYLHEFNAGRPTKFVFDFEDVEKFLNVSKHLDETVGNLLDWTSCYKQQVSKHPEMFFDDGGKFIKQCERKIERIKGGQAEGLHNAVRPQINSSAVVSPPAEGNTKQESRVLRYGFSKEQVLNYFMQLSKYYTEEQVMLFLKANFEGFAEPGEKIVRTKFPEHKGVDRSHIMYMIYTFWKQQKERMFNKKAAAILLEENFTCFESFNIVSSEPVESRTVYSNMRKEPRRGYPFSCAMLG